MTLRTAEEAREALQRKGVSISSWAIANGFSVTSKKVGTEYVKAYEAKYGPGSRSPFGGHFYDAYLVLDKAVAVAAQKAKPGTEQFRAALRDAIEATKGLPVTHGVVNMSPTDHSGLGKDARVLITPENGAWKLVQ